MTEGVSFGGVDFPPSTTQQTQISDEVVTTKEKYYNLKNYEDELSDYVVKKYKSLDCISKMQADFNKLFSVIFNGAVSGDKERFPHTAELYKVYKAALIQACLSGYTALFSSTGLDAYSILKSPEVRKVMTEQFKSIALLENLSAETVDDWLLKGEAVEFIKLKTNAEEYRVKATMTDQATGQDILSFKIKEGVSYDSLEAERIDPLNFFCDAYDYKKDPRGCAKIIRSYIDSKTLLSSSAYPLLSSEDKQEIINSVGRNGRGINNFFAWTAFAGDTPNSSRTDKDNIEVLTYYGDYIAKDYNVLSNIVATVVGNKLADVRYSAISTPRIIYAPYKIDKDTHRGISPLLASEVVNELINKVVDLYIQNLDITSVPLMMYTQGSMSKMQADRVWKDRQIEFADAVTPPTFFNAQPANPQGINLMQMILEQSKNVLGLNNYLAGDTDGAVRTARESSILFEKANARMRVETDVFSYNFMLPLFTYFYCFNRELAIAYDNPLYPIYSDPNLKISISTNASKADEEGEFQRLMNMLQLPISQMIFSNLKPDQVLIAVRYLMAKAQLDDADNLLELFDADGNPTTYVDDTQQQQQQQQQSASNQQSELPQQESNMINNIDSNNIQQQQ